MKTRRLWLFCGMRTALAIVTLAGVIGAPQLLAQYMKAPDAYTVTEKLALSGPGSTTTVYRDGSKAVMEIAGADGKHTRTLYDLQAHTSTTWTAENASAGCSTGTFSGDWGDPFAMSADMTKDLAKPEVKMTGAETVNGFATKVYEIAGPTPAQSAKAWVDNKYGLVIKANVGGTPFIEVKAMTAAKPVAAVFALPPACAKAAAAGPPMTPAQQMAADAGVKNPQDYADAIMPATSGAGNSCAALFKIVRAGTMEPVTNAFAIGVDLDQNSTGGYSMGKGPNGSHFVGGTIKDMTSQYKNGVLRIDNVPPHFMLDVEFSASSSANALIYRQCPQPQSVLLLVVKNPNNVAEGKIRWLWSKTGK